MQIQRRVSIVSNVFETPEDEYVPIYDENGVDINPEGQIVVNGRRPVQQNRFDINSFRAEFSKDNVLSTHSYLVTLSPFRVNSKTGQTLTRFIKNNTSAITMRCDTAILPGVRLLKDETIRRYGYGPIERVPYSIQFNEITLNWIMDSRAEVFNFFDTWMHSIVNFDSSGGQDMRTPRRIGNISFSPYEIGYKDDYACPKMDIFVYDHQLKQAIIYEIFDVFPSAINDVPVAWGEQDNLLKYSIEFSYTDINIRTPYSLTEEEHDRVLQSIMETDNSRIYTGIEGIYKLI